ncbi:uncharacterized protein BJ212DRAFT_1480533 [Suillus subaureus]|uniref:Uncharacterized protein n=1 Tax=Suillus subaureus TaxID=48587 RepID=A0A9P7EC55_9AGAM|nr:uncharacterized protein BJ212DRAFT_1480533 [Suillus subaureus]KAG1816660.1 hypothetical protein BJ212DRAFT_1480533 [Suillus subaureus]
MAILLIEAEKNLDTANLIEKFSALIQGPIVQLEEKATRIEEATATHKEALENAVKELRGTLSNSSENIEKAVLNVTKASQDMPKATQPEGMHTYVNAVKTNAPPPLTKLLACGEAQARQILLDRHSYESAKWLSIPSHQAKFAVNFGSNATIKDQSYHILIENVPTSYDPSSICTNSDIETNGGLKPGTITKAKWIKLIARCKANQRMAHMIITLKTEESTNQILCFGVSIEGKKQNALKTMICAELAVCIAAQQHAKATPHGVEIAHPSSTSGKASKTDLKTQKNNTGQWIKPPRQPVWTQPVTDTNTHGNYGCLLMKTPHPQPHPHPQPQPQQLNMQQEQQKHRQPCTNPNKIQIGLNSQAYLMDNWLNLQPANENNTDPHVHPNSPPQISSASTTPLWFPPPQLQTSTLAAPHYPTLHNAEQQ